jgi:hypothetical protein
LATFVQLREAQHRRNEPLTRGLAEQALGNELAARPPVAFQREQRQIVLGARIALLGGLFEQRRAFFAIPLYALAGPVHQPERHLRRRIPLFGSFLVPARCCPQVFLDAVTVGVKDAKAERGGGAALVGSALIPPPGLFVVAFAANPARTNQPGIGLRVDDSLLGGRPAPAQRLGRFLRHVEAVRKEKLAIVLGRFAVALGGHPVPSRDARRVLGVASQVEQAELVLRFGMILLRSSPIIESRVGEVGKDPMAAGIEQPQTIVCFGIPRRGGGRPRL